MNRTLQVVLLVAAMAGVVRADTTSLAELLGPRAHEHYVKGKAHYDLQEYAAAIDEFRTGYRLVRHPVFVFAIAKAQQKAGDCTASLDSLRRFVQTAPGDEWVKRANEEAAECERRLAEAATQRQHEAALARRRGQWQVAREVAVDLRARRRRWALVTFGAGVLSTIGGIVAVSRQRSAIDDSRGAPGADAYADAVDRADRWRIAASALGVAGSAMLVGGAALWLTAPSVPSMPAEFRATVVGISFAGRF